MRVLLAALALLCVLSVAQAEPTPEQLYATDYWQIVGPAGKITWIEIHNRAEAPASGVAHLEVLARRKGAQIWDVEHLCGHLAITTAALQRSVLRPYKTRSVYPETYTTAYKRWKADEQHGTSNVCSTSIQDFLRWK